MSLLSRYDACWRWLCDEQGTPWYPGMRVLFISGYSKQFLEAHADTVEGSAFLSKPFSLEAMARRVRELLDEKWVEAGS